MPNVGTLTLSLRASTGQLGPDLNKGIGLAQAFSGKVTSLMTGVANKLGAAAAGFASVEFVKSSINAFAEQETAVKRLDSVLDATKGTVGLTSQEIQNFATQMQHTTRFADELTDSAASVLATFTNVKGAQFLGGLEAAMNIATIKSMDLVSATTLVGKALNSPADGLKKLKKVGIDFDSQTKSNILSLNALGKTAEAQQVLLDALAGVFGGAAQNDLETYAGKIDLLKNALDELKETLGGYAAPEIASGLAAITNLVNGVTGNRPTGAIDTERARLGEIDAIIGKGRSNKVGGRSSLSSSQLESLERDLLGITKSTADKIRSVQRQGLTVDSGSTDFLKSLKSRRDEVSAELMGRSKNGQLLRDRRLEALFQPSGGSSAAVRRMFSEATAPKTIGKQGFSDFFKKQADLLKQADSIFEDTRTPQEAAVRKLLELDKLKGVLDPQTFNRAFAAAEFNPNKAKATHFGAASAEKNSQEALTAIARHQSQQKDPAEEALKKQEEANKALNRVDGGIKEMNKQLRDQQKLKVVEFA